VNALYYKKIFDKQKAMTGKVASQIPSESRRMVQDGGKKELRKSSESMTFEKG